MEKVIGMMIELDGFINNSEGSVGQDSADFTEWRVTAVGQHMIRAKLRDEGI